MNERNVGALQVAIVGAVAAIEKLGGCAPTAAELDRIVKVSRYLAIGIIGAAGVLVPSALTDEECSEVAIAGKDADGAWDYALVSAVREELERIAHGIPPRGQGGDPVKVEHYSGNGGA